jgi:hypothetical protein
MLLPEPATIRDGIRGEQVGKRTGQTLSVDPKKRSCRLPLLKDAALKEPACRFLVISTTRDVVVCRRVWWGEPFVNAFPQLFP